jgi:hypothetical protein
MIRGAAARVGWIVCAAGVIALCAPAPALAHPPYERLERVVVDARGRELRLVLSYVDGIISYDPVKLVVRDSNHRTIGETGKGRSISVICARPPACVVFVYGEFSPVPSQTWRLVNSQLEATPSTALAAFGIVAPLWSDAWGYIIATGFLLLPWPVLVLLWRAGNAPPAEASTPFFQRVVRAMAIVCGFVGIAFYYFSCWWMIMLLVELSPLLTVVSALIVWGSIAFSRHHTRRAVVVAA